MQGGVLVLALVLASTLSCGRSTPRAASPPVADQITLYEGLPHLGYEAEKFAEESKKPTIDKGGFPFYRDPLALNEVDARALGSILADPATFPAVRGREEMRRFHPDYAIVASSNAEATTYLICFGCGEAKVLRPDRSETRYDLGRDVALPRLSAILKPYQKNRPGPIGGP